MNYLKSLFFNFLAVFFANHILPGIDVINQTKLPHLGGDLPFAIVLGLLNSLIYPAFKLLKRHAGVLRIIAVALILNFGAYAILKLISAIGIRVSSFEGYFAASIVVTLGSFLTNFLEMKHDQRNTSSPMSHDPFKK